MKKLLLAAFLLIGQISLLAQDAKPKIPVDLGKTPFVLLVVEPEKNAPKRWVEDALKDCYKGEYIMVSKEELYHKKYADKTKYAYALKTFDKFTAGSFGAGGRKGPDVSYDYGIEDLKTGKTYYYNSDRVNYKKMIKEYVKEIEKQRIANGG